MKYVIFKFCCLFALMVSCKTTNILQSSRIGTSQQLTVGSIGTKENYILQKSFVSSAVPRYPEPIKIAITLKTFNKYTYTLYSKSQNLKSSGITLNYVDSLPDKPKYLQLSLADKVGVIAALNHEANIGVKDYLSHNDGDGIISSISMALQEIDLEAVTTSDAVFLIEKGYKNYALQLYNNGKIMRTVDFNQGVIFEYKTVNCCWHKNKRQQLNIVDLVGIYNHCPNQTYRSVKRANKKENYYKI